MIVYSNYQSQCYNAHLINLRNVIKQSLKTKSDGHDLVINISPEPKYFLGISSKQKQNDT